MNGRYDDLAATVRRLLEKPRSKLVLARLNELVNMKVCITCQEKKNISEFDKNNEAFDGRRSTCKTCRKNRAETALKKY